MLLSRGQISLFILPDIFRLVNCFTLGSGQILTTGFARPRQERRHRVLRVRFGKHAAALQMVNIASRSDGQRSARGRSGFGEGVREYANRAPVHYICHRPEMMPVIFYQYLVRKQGGNFGHKAN